MASNERRSRRTPNLPSREGSWHTSLNSVDSISKETPIDYLFKNNVTSLVTESINCLMRYRPTDPIQFLMDYFSSVALDPVDEACMKLSWAHFTNKSYQRNVLEVYHMLISGKSKESHLYGLLGDRFNGLLFKLSEELPEQVSNACMKKLKARNTQVILFNRFYHAVLLLHVIKDFIETVHGIYLDLDVGNVGKASDSLCTFVLTKLQSGDSASHFKKNAPYVTDGLKQMDISMDTSIYPESALFDLREMMESISANSTKPECMEQEAFVDMAVQIFLDKV